MHLGAIYLSVGVGREVLLTPDTGREKGCINLIDVVVVAKSSLIQLVQAYFVLLTTYCPF